jgi:hypothetical protein
MADAALTLEALAAIVAQQAREIEALRELVGGRSAADQALLDELSGAVAPGETFMAAQVCDAAAIDQDLRAALEAVAGTGQGQARRLGKALHRAQGAVLGSYELRRVGQNREGAAWSFMPLVRE